MADLAAGILNWRWGQSQGGTGRVAHFLSTSDLPNWENTHGNEPKCMCIPKKLGPAWWVLSHCSWMARLKAVDHCWLLSWRKVSWRLQSPIFISKNRHELKKIKEEQHWLNIADLNYCQRNGLFNSIFMIIYDYFVPGHGQVTQALTAAVYRIPSTSTACRFYRQLGHCAQCKAPGASYLIHTMII